MATIKDVARAADLSVTTVSRALNDHLDVAEATRAHVRGVAERLGYHPNHTARSLQGTRTDTIGLVIPQLMHRYVDSFWLEFIGGVTSVCSRAHLDLLISMGSSPAAEFEHYQRLVRSKRVDGVIVSDVRTDDRRIRFLRQCGAAFVAFGRTLDVDDYSWVDVDGAAGLHLALDHLLALGHRRIAFLGTDSAFTFSHFRLLGYRQALAGAGLPIDERLVFQNLDLQSDFEAVIDRALGVEAPVTAIVAGADFLASGVLRSLRRRGIRVPEDISLLAFDDTLVTEHADPPLCCLRQDNRAIGEHVAQLLCARLRGEDNGAHHALIQPDLVLRRSTARAPERS